jgi:TetR/AcrR family transcriptional repressor of nem operon
MKVTRAQAEANRQAVVEAAGRLFREHGVKGVGLAELMGAAGLTHGGFYKQFKSKDDLVAEACGAALAEGPLKWTRIVGDAGARREAPLAALVRHYLSPAHRDRIGEGCALAGLGPDAVRHDTNLRRRFEDAVRAHAGVIERALPSSAGQDDALATLSTMVGALLLARMVEDDAFSRQILDAASARLLDACLLDPSSSQKG